MFINSMDDVNLGEMGFTTIRIELYDPPNHLLWSSKTNPWETMVPVIQPPFSFSFLRKQLSWRRMKSLRGTNNFEIQLRATDLFGRF